MNIDAHHLPAKIDLREFATLAHSFARKVEDMEDEIELLRTENRQLKEEIKKVRGLNAKSV